MSGTCGRGHGSIIGTIDRHETAQRETWCWSILVAYSFTGMASFVSSECILSTIVLHFVNVNKQADAHQGLVHGLIRQAAEASIRVSKDTFRST